MYGLASVFSTKSNCSGCLSPTAERISKSWSFSLTLRSPLSFVTRLSKGESGLHEFPLKKVFCWIFGLSKKHNSPTRQPMLHTSTSWLYLGWRSITSGDLYHLVCTCMDICLLNVSFWSSIFSTVIWILFNRLISSYSLTPLISYFIFCTYRVELYVKASDWHDCWEMNSLLSVMSCSIDRAIPKSQTMTEQCSSTMRLLGFRSRCIILALWMNYIAQRILYVSTSKCSSSKLPCSFYILIIFLRSSLW